MKRLVASLFVLVVVAGALLLLREEADAPARVAATTAAVAAPATADPLDETPAERVEEGAPLVLDGGAADELAAAALPRVACQAAVREAAAAAGRGEVSPDELARRLHDAVSADPRAAGEALLAELEAPRSPEAALEVAQALARTLEDRALRAEAVAALERGGPEVRAVGLLALLGRGEPECLALARRAFEQDPDEARATAGFLLGLVFERLSSRDAAAVREAARAALARPDASARVREESLGLLGRDGATDADVATIERALFDPEPAVRGRAFLALVDSGAPAGRSRPVLERALDDPATPEPLRLAIRAQLQSS